ncbi:MAG: T9SS type A sorting domain-containing protein [Melioribacteraceae bacterium]|nr:T9SS type A sorting domain-containing protein [Melioribacteraceae bacterium]MCF8356208.1 T9SS type A sorting domain-containing protein [Melioribacteraceae bacterium]MCF8395861.1 T9SS type A sorting domain-containing protein [Melioribacteraceae bacterium]MCF8420045.1 T9SS type A sorting domain-containing protein [Melioribacteraceae bacterium]
MRKLTTILLFLSSVLFAQSGIISVQVGTDSITVRHDGSERNCGSLFYMEAELVNDTLIITEVDTGDLAFCMCYFDLEATIGMLPPGEYRAEVYGTDSLYGTYWGGTDFTIPGIAVFDEYQSECLPLTKATNDTAFIELTVDGFNLNLFWDTPLINCCLIAEWSAELIGDTFYVVMTDVGDPCDCVCPFELSVSFGPFEPGEYILDFEDGEYGYPAFTIPGTKESVVVVGSQFQSDCYDINSVETETIPKNFKLHPAYPNPFNPSTNVIFEIPEISNIEIAVYNILGEKIKILMNDKLQLGKYDITWDGTNQDNVKVGSGIYLIVMKSGEYLQTIKAALLK